MEILGRVTRRVTFRDGVLRKRSLIIAAAGLIAASGLALRVALAQQPGITRTDLMRNDLSAPGREVVQVLVAFAPGVMFPRHSHPGEEIVYVVEGVLDTDSTAARLRRSRPVRCCSSRPGESTRSRTSAAARGPNSRPTSSRKGSPSSRPPSDSSLLPVTVTVEASSPLEGLRIQTGVDLTLSARRTVIPLPARHLSRRSR